MSFVPETAQVSRSIPDIDRWSHLDHRIGIRDHSTLGTAPGWLPQREWRRLTAYRYLDAVNKSSARWFIPADDEEERNAFLEFGDAFLFGDRIASGVVGNQIELTVDGAEHPPPSVPPVPDAPVEPETDDPVDRASYEAQVQVRAFHSAIAIDEWKQQWAEYPTLVEAQRWLAEWAAAEHFAANVYEMEASNVVPLGDGIATFQWDSEVSRPTMNLWDPDAYFPVLDDLDDGRFPEKVHLAWEEEDDDGQVWVRRITYELVDWPAWNPEYGNETANRMCLISDGRWKIEQFEDRTIEDLTVEAAEWKENLEGQEMNQLPLMLDFIPLLHFPNGFSKLQHFGQSSLAVGIQVLEQIAQADTDTAAAAELAGTPQVAVSGTNVAGDLEIDPGTAWGLGEGGRMDVIDQSAPLMALIEYEKTLQERAERILKVPAGVLGRNANREIRSGIALQISNFPFDQEINKLRLSREPKYRLALKMVQRIAIQGGSGPPLVAPARVAFGSHLPSDLVEATNNVALLVNAGAISRATGIRWLVDSGMAIDDATSEIARILSEDTAGALEVFNATGSQTAAANRLGIDLPTDAVNPNEVPDEPFGAPAAPVASAEDQPE
jgi:hypothetical protein